MMTVEELREAWEEWTKHLHTQHKKIDLCLAEVALTEQKLIKKKAKGWGEGPLQWLRDKTVEQEAAKKDTHCQIHGIHKL